MNNIKRMLSAFLAVAMIIASMATSSPIEVNAKSSSNWQSSAIIAPEQGKLIGAGYIDIKWSNDLDNVKSYDVYVDGKLAKNVAATSTETMSYEMYTTQVSAHTAQITGILSDGTKVTTPVRTFYVTKKGICVNTRDMGAAVDPADMNLGWYYNWGTKSFKEQNYKNKKFYDLEFVPMVYGEGGLEAGLKNANEQGYKYMLAFNEPDLRNESNIQPNIAASRWKNYFVAKKGNLRLGSPAISTAKPVWDSDWFSSYWGALSQADKDATSFIAVHQYYEYYNEDTAYEFLEMLDRNYEKYHKPMWITEFALWRFDKNSKDAYKAQEFMKIVCKGLDERSYVERYSWFCPNYNDTAASSSAVFEYSTGALTPIGKIYAQIGNPAGYKAKTYGVNSSTNADTSINGVIAIKKTLLSGLTKKKKAFGYNVITIKRAAGYQIQYGTKKSMAGAKTVTKANAYGKVSVKFTAKQKKQIKKKKLKKITYYVRVRAFKKILGVTGYCQWSPVKSVAVKTK